MLSKKGLMSALKLLPEHIIQKLEVLPEEKISQIREIRLRTGRPPTLTCVEGAEKIPDCPEVTKEDIAETAARAFRNSIHSSTDRLCAGYVTYENGCRVGLSGTACRENGKIVSIKQISSLCIRIPREIIGCSEDIFQSCLSERPASLLICGAPSSGKTTYLRDLTRLCGGRYRTALIDERGELAGISFGIPTNDVGLLTDIFDDYPRKEAIETAVRAMSPQMIVCDEIGSAEDVQTLGYAIRSGVSLIATCHCGDLEDLANKPNISELIKTQIFDYAVLLENCKVKQMRVLREEKCSGL
ncbi:stage III sporulation protein AA [Ruminococcus sp.]|uniref:stage III sporulation protein AA n=1 Tax=Ruminococcus sp. TaxID=41978 RepID=UPI0025ED8A47|nr:stage III sporulation protein AA [Ruminococcus sp.]MBQ8965252.1 stage III sporulation protein AA [Ruminococcus sp.]